MTTEIVIMNKSAVALAADSAVTIAVPGPKGKNCKILNSANKLFSLSKCAPVGLMIYGNATMLGVPWETIVKMYRERLRDKEFSTLDGYSNDFFKFLDDFDIGEIVEKNYVENNAKNLFGSIRVKLDNWVEEEIKKKNLTTQEIDNKLEELIKDSCDEFLRLGNQSVLSKTKRSSLRTKYRPDIEKVAKLVFENRPLSKQMKAHLLTIAVNAASIGPLNQSGIVITGFGADELYPSCQNFDVAAVFSGKTIKRDGELQSINNEMEATIISFAQNDDVKTFMEGIGPVLDKFLKDVFLNIMTKELPDNLSDQIASNLNLDGLKKSNVRQISGDMCKGAYDFAFKELSKQQRFNYIEPVVRATGFLNKAELASMAETLVNLVSFRKQVTMEAETVGGPIDVAVITKGDGLVWVKRKHYFPAELNHHFFSNYFRKVKCDEYKNKE